MISQIACQVSDTGNSMAMKIRTGAMISKIQDPQTGSALSVWWRAIVLDNFIYLLGKYPFFFFFSARDKTQGIACGRQAFVH
jgi:hypothetical protein